MYSTATQLSALRSRQFWELVQKHRPWLTPKEAAAYLHVSIRTLESWRAGRVGPSFTKHRNGFVRYHISAPDAFMRVGDALATKVAVLDSA